jgi:hypothetical protein
VTTYDQSNNVQFPKPNRFNPEAAEAKAGASALKSYQYIPKFRARDTAPVTVVDAATQAARNVQIIRICKSLCPGLSDGVTDTQILDLHRDYMAGRI